MITFAPFRMADYLRTEADRKAYRAACAEDNDPELMKLAERDIAESRS